MLTPRPPVSRFLLALVLLFGAAGCASNASSKPFDLAAAPVPQATVASPVVELAAAAQQDAAPTGRKVVYSADLDVTVEDPVEGSRATTAAAVDAGGFRVSERVLENRVDVVVRVPPKQFQATIDAIARLGMVKRRNITSADLTADFVDLQTRLKNAKVSRDRLSALLADSVQVDNIIKVEAALQERQSLVEQLEGQMKVLGSQVSLSTISATFVTPRHAADLEIDRDVPGFGRGLRNGWAAFRNTFAWGLTALGALVPFVLLLAVLVGLGRLALQVRTIRRRNLAAGIPVTDTGEGDHQIGSGTPPVPDDSGDRDQDLEHG